MIYLVMMKLRDEGYGGSSQDSIRIIGEAVLPTLKVLKKLEEENRVMGGFFDAQRSGAMMIRAENDDELEQILTSLPAWGIFDLEVVSLESFQEAEDRDKRVMEGLKSAAGR